MDELDEFDPELDLSRFVDVNTDDATIHEKDGTRVRPHDAEGDDDTISTLRTDGTLNTIKEGDPTAGASSGTSIASGSTINSQDRAVLSQMVDMLPGLQAMASAMPSTPQNTILRTGLMSVARLTSPSSKARKTGDKR